MVISNYQRVSHQVSLSTPIKSPPNHHQIPSNPIKSPSNPIKSPFPLHFPCIFRVPICLTSPCHQATSASLREARLQRSYGYAKRRAQRLLLRVMEPRCQRGCPGAVLVAVGVTLGRFFFNSI
jgi:hypothetical protein